MSWTPESSAIRMTPALEKEISEALPEQIKAILGRAAYEQGLVVPDAANPQILHPTALAANAPRKFAKYVTVDGQRHLLEGGSPEELANAETDLYQQLFEKSDDGQARDSQGRFVAEPTAAEKAAQELATANRAELELKFKRGDITAEQYLEQSGAIGTYLENHGILPEALATVSDALYQNTWAQATEQFLNSESGASWPGGEQNMKTLAAILEENGMTEPSVENLSAAYQYARENNLLQPNPELEAHNAIAEANSVEQIREAMGRPTGSSGLFDRR